MAVILETSIGDLTVDLYTDERPICCKNFLKLCKTKYYNFSLFHTIQRGFIAQTGDPTNSGRGGASVFEKLYGDQARYFEAEKKPRIKHKKIGTVSMVNNGNDMHGSQFFITLAPDLDYLDGVHTVFGEVAEGLETIQKFNDTIVDDNNRPYKDVRIFHTVVLDDPYEDPAGLREFIPERSPEPTKEILDSGRIRVDEDIDDKDGKTTEEIDEMIKEKEAKANAQILEMVGDLPDTECAPPENVLFVCKLNPVTTAEDLEIIFSRFGTIVNCEVIKDQKTGESLQYAFIEFENPDQCEQAYFKMDNVLIDERRIHVDFSQSVSKIKWKGKGRGVEIISDKKEDSRPKYHLKDRQRTDNYDLIMSDEDSPNKEKKSKKKKKKHKRSDSSESDSSTNAKRRDKKRHRSRSPRERDDQQRTESRKDHKSSHKHRDNERDYDNRDRDRDRRDWHSNKKEKGYEKIDYERRDSRTSRHKDKYRDKDRR